MQLAELQKQILSDSLNRYMQFFGDEYAVQDIYLNRIYEKLGAEVIRLDTVQEAYQQMVKSRMSKSQPFHLRRASEPRSAQEFRYSSMSVISRMAVCVSFIGLAPIYKFYIL